KNNPGTHANLGLTLSEMGRLDEAITAYRAALRINPDFAKAHHGLGLVLQQKGRLNEAIAAFREVLRIDKDNAPARADLDAATRRAELDKRLPAILAGTVQPRDAAEQIEVGKLCHLKRLYRAAARFFGDALAAQPALADDPDVRYDAACAAALAGCGQGE